MGTQFVKGYTNNHLTWVMVDATDFATPESALSAATKIKIWGKLKGQAAANFVSSGTGSLTNDIVHVGPSVLGIYSIALVKADLSDASAAWYDQYIISMSATGAAYQTIIVDGGIWISDLSAIASDIRSDVSDMHSDLIVMSGILSDTLSMATANSGILSDILSCVRGNSDVLSNMSNILSDFYSDFQSRVPKLVANNSQLSALWSDLDSTVVSQIATLPTASDVASKVWREKYTAAGNKGASSFGSLFDLTASGVSDLTSRITKAVATNSQLVAVQSDIKSAVAAGPAATITASDISDIASAVWAAKYLGTGAHNQASSFGSAFRVMKSDVSDIDSMLTAASDMLSNMSNILSDFYSDFQSRVPKAVATNSQLSALWSDLDSAIVSATSDIKSAVAAGPTASASDIASKVWAQKYTAAGNKGASSFGSLFTLAASSVSDLDSRISSTPATKAAVASATYALFSSDLSAIKADLSDTHSDLIVMSGILSDVLSCVRGNSDVLSNMSNILSDFYSDFQSRVPKAVATNSQLSALWSDLDSTVVSQASDLKSAIAAGPAATITASDMSDIVSRIWAAKYFGAAAHNQASSFGSAFRVMHSDVSDLDSMLTVMSDVLSGVFEIASDTLSAVILVQSDTSTLVVRVPKAVATNSQLVAVQSDIKSAVAAGPAATITVSDISNIASAVWGQHYVAHVGASSFGSVLQVRLPKRVATDSQLSALWSDLDSTVVSQANVVKSNVLAQASDVKSAVAAGGGVATISASDISDIASAVWSQKYIGTGAHNQPSSFGSAFRVMKSDVSDIDSMLTAASDMLSNMSNVLSDFYSDFQSRVPKAVATNSQVAALANLTASQVKVQVVNALSVDTYAEPGQGAPAATAPLSTKIGHLYKLSRNKVTQDATTLKVFSDNEATVDAKATVSDDGTTYTRGELVTGP